MATVAAPARADDGPDGEWNGATHLDFTPYVWVPTINGSFAYHLSDLPPALDAAVDETKTFQTTVGPNNYLAKLNFALMGELHLRKGNFSLFGDFIDMNASGQALRVHNFNGPSDNLNYAIGSSGQGQIVASIFTVDATATVFHHGGTNVDLLAGGRFLYLSGNANLTLTGTDAMGDTHTFSAGVSQKENYSNFVFGSMGQIGLAKKLSLPYYIDFGPGSLATYEGQIGMKYGNLSLNWRHLQYTNNNQSALLQSLSLDGPSLAYTLHIW